MKSYIFDIEHAKRYGVDEAIMLQNLIFWINKNRANEKHFHENRYWTYCSAKAFTELFPFWSEGQIRRILKSLQEQGAILVGNWSENQYDRTAWYALSDAFVEIETSICRNQQMDITKTTNPNDENGISYTDNKTDIKPNSIKYKGTAESLCLFSNSRYNDLELFSKEFDKPEFEGIDIAYYFYAVADWSSQKGKKMRDWIATARNFIRKDIEQNKVHRLRVGNLQSMYEYINSMQ